VSLNAGSVDIDWQTFQRANGINPSDRVLIINFIGEFGIIENMESMKPKNVLKTIENNILPFLNLLHLLRMSGKNSMMISFSGAGLGGSNLENASLGYLASKGSMALISEALTMDYASKQKFLCLVAPGPFPSRMQETVATNEFPEFESNRSKARSVSYNEGNLVKLLRMVEWLSQNPEQASGRIWSALHDELPPSGMSEQYGRLRRIF
jgi:NAD(P)-dependent dehydrogenase (short-subunit alcohol dehydrogenase family)